MALKDIEWKCPWCGFKNFGICPVTPPGTPCMNCGQRYYIGAVLDHIQALDIELQTIFEGKTPGWGGEQ